MVDCLDERVQMIKDLLEGGKIIVYRPRQRVSEQRISERVPVSYHNDTSFENVAEHNEERWFQVTLQREDTQCQGNDDESGGPTLQRVLNTPCVLKIERIVSMNDRAWMTSSSSPL